ncbi:hypothetical protein J2T13_000817 [Paenibacillus sp. DS2015]|uniref:helix-turn-helix domain-containing protein n=1 Tax=Paenibacillus sp. DS2015 TaxID=3373917 RepID=UPI003D236137
MGTSKYLRVKDICEILGCSTQYVSELLKKPLESGGIPCIRLSQRMILIDPIDFKAWGERMKGVGK